MACWNVLRAVFSAVRTHPLRRCALRRVCTGTSLQVVRLFNAYNTDVENLMKGAAKVRVASQTAA